MFSSSVSKSSLLGQHGAHTLYFVIIKRHEMSCKVDSELICGLNHFTKILKTHIFFQSNPVFGSVRLPIQRRYKNIEVVACGSVGRLKQHLLWVSRVWENKE